ncbi:MAG: hypothetical protein VX941_02145 [Pseudomonadota bacterium]|nr:hypothetical protein [Pseudomonadota bacterium]
MTTTNNKVGALIPVRLDSERLPGKALMEICGRPIIYHLLDRVTACKHIITENIVVCTTEEPSDDPLVGVVEAYGASIFRGSTDDIIERFHAAISHFNFDAVIQVDGDDPLSATEYMNLTMDRLLGDTNLDIVTCRGLPLGTAVKSFSKDAMELVFDRYRSTQNDTGFIYYFTKTGICRQAEVSPLSPDHIHDEARLTLDYRQDFEMFKVVFEELYTPSHLPGLSEVVRYLRSHPGVVALNTNLNEEYWKRTQEKVALKFEDESGKLHSIPMSIPSI